MIESLLKELGERHFEILWRYESATNSIVIQMDKRDCHQRHRLVRKVMFDAMTFVVLEAISLNLL